MTMNGGGGETNFIFFNWLNRLYKFVHHLHSLLCSSMSISKFHYLRYGYVISHQCIFLLTETQLPSHFCLYSCSLFLFKHLSWTAFPSKCRCACYYFYTKSKFGPVPLRAWNFCLNNVMQVISVWRINWSIYLWVLRILLFFSVKYVWFYANCLLFWIYGMQLLRILPRAWDCWFPCLVDICALYVSIVSSASIEYLTPLI